MSSIRDNLRVGDCAFLGVNTMDGASQKDEFGPHPKTHTIYL